ncbi:hypothetical protein PIB30_093273 [Stylosanthes scabra]|uniref:Uncharacterized protein n=1 Tax=Stylosanthes scabra TaxID=79078 RepID=A0ABU6YSP0_9FABA|nr:hypothetical protein [Stylosanthes scabra]
MEGRPIHLGRIINSSMYHATTGASDQRLPFPVLISRMAVANEVPTFFEDQYIIIEGKDRFCLFGDWKGEKKKARKGNLTQPPPAPIPPPISQPRSQPASSSATEELMWILQS